MPPYFPAVTSGYTFTQGVDISTEILAEAAGGVGGFRYGLSGLPDGLSFDPASRTLSGAPAADGDYSMTYTATDADGATASAAIAVTVLAVAESHGGNHPPVILTLPPVWDNIPKLPEGDYVRLYLEEGHELDNGSWFEDPDGDPLIFSVESQYPGIATVRISGGNGLETEVRNAGTVLITITATDPAGETADHVVTIVAIAERYTREIPENSPPGSPVGAPVSGQVSGGVSPSHYQLLGPDASTFVIDPASGQISLANHTSLDYETKTSYDVYVLYDMGGTAARIDVTIEVTDIAPPGTPDEPTVERLATDTPGETGLRVTWTPPAGGPVDEYVLRRLRDTLATELESPYDKTQTSVEVWGLQHSTHYGFGVRADNVEGNGPDSVATWQMTNRPPQPNGGYIDRTPQVGTERTFDIVADGKFTDADGDTLRVYGSSDLPGFVSVRVEEANGSLTAQALNPGRVARVTYGVTDGYGGKAELVMQLTGERSETLTVPENSPPGTPVGDPVTGTPYQGAALTYRLTGDAKDTFDIDGATGQISVAEGASLDYETGPNTFTGQVKYEVAGRNAVVDVTIEVTDVRPDAPEAPTAERLRTDTIGETGLGVAWTPPNDNGFPITEYKLRFRKESEETTTGVTLDSPSAEVGGLEPGATYHFKVRAVSAEGDGPWSEEGAGSTNRPPSMLEGERDGSYQIPGTVVIDPRNNFVDDDGDTLKFYRLESQHPGLMPARVGPDGTLATVELYHPISSLITYTLHDGYGGSVQDSFTTTATRSENRQVPENSPPGTAVGSPVAGRPYLEETFTYSLTGAAAAKFSINPATGQVEVKDGVSLDYETGPNRFEGQVEYTVGGQPARISVVIEVTDIPPPAKPDAPTVERQRSHVGQTGLIVDWTAPETTAVRRLPNTMWSTGYRARGTGHSTGWTFRLPTAICGDYRPARPTRFGCARSAPKGTANGRIRVRQRPTARRPLTARSLAR